jgi:hypothetical protein
LDHPIADGRDPQPAQLATRLGDQPLPHGQRRKPPRLQVGSKAGEERIHAMAPLDVAGDLPVDPGGARALVAPDPVPCHQQERRVTDEIEQIIEPA